MSSTVQSRTFPHGIIGVLDVGTSKTICMIAGKPRSFMGLRGPEIAVLGAGMQRSRGLKAGVVVDLDAAEQCVRAAVVQAERAAGVTLEEVFVAAACGRLRSSTFVADAKIEGRIVGDPDVGRIMAAGRAFAEREGRALVHMNCLAYRLDDAVGLADPRGLAGAMLGADLHVVTSDDAPLQNLVHVLERAYLSVSGVAPAPYASGLGASTMEERRQGIACIDIGAGTTNISVFCSGHLLAIDVIPVGGHHITSDLARALSCPLAEAERIKTLCGRVDKVAAGSEDAATYRVAGDAAPGLQQTTTGHVRQIVSNRLSGLFGQIAERIERSGLARQAVQRIILTGGTSQMTGLAEFAADFFARPVRVAQPQTLAGTPPQFSGAAFSTAIGLVTAALDPTAGVHWEQGGVQRGSTLRRVGAWLRESF